MQVTLWNDYICPWAYAARPHSEWMRSEGLEVVVRSYELHPNIPAEGRETRPGGRLNQVFDHIAIECERLDLEFVKPSRSPNTHRLLGLCEIVGAYWSEQFDRFDAELAAIHWVRGEALDDPAVLRAAIESAGLPFDELTDLEADGVGERMLEQSMADARELGVTGTPAWRVGEMTITGLHPMEQFQRWVRRLVERAG